MGQTKTEILTFLHSHLDAWDPKKEEGSFADFEHVSVLAWGGMGVVLKARDKRLQRIVAVKTLLPNAIADTRAKERFKKEAVTLAHLEHDHIVTIFDVGEHNGLPFLSMSYLEGETLAARLRSRCNEFRNEIASMQRGPLTRNDIVTVSIQVTSALLAAHSSGPTNDSGVIHRDVKPANIWIKDTAQHEDLRVVLLDFGLAKRFDVPGTETGFLMGTPLYMSPEQADGVATPSPQSDLFSLGTVIYEMCTGRNPFGEVGDDQFAVLRRVREAHAPPISIESIPDTLRDLVCDLHERTPKRRPGAPEVLRRLQRISEEPVTTKIIGVDPETAKRKLRRRTILSLLGGVLFGLTGSFLLPRATDEAATGPLLAPTLQYFPEATVDGQTMEHFKVNPPKPLGDGVELENGPDGSVRVTRRAGATFEPFFGVTLTVRPGGHHDSWAAYRDGVLEITVTPGSSTQTITVKPETFPSQTPAGIELPNSSSSQTILIPVTDLLSLVNSQDVNQLIIEAEDIDKESDSFFQLQLITLRPSQDTNE